MLGRSKDFSIFSHHFYSASDFLLSATCSCSASNDVRWMQGTAVRDFKIDELDQII